MGHHLKADYDIPTAKLYTDACVDTIDVCMKKTACKIVYRGIKNMGSSIYDKLLNLAIPSQELRSSDIPNAEIPKCRTKFGEYNIAFRGSVYWNQIPVEIRMSQSLDQFKHVINDYKDYGWNGHQLSLTKSICLIISNC